MRVLPPYLGNNLELVGHPHFFARPFQFVDLLLRYLCMIHLFVCRTSFFGVFLFRCAVLCLVRLTRDAARTNQAVLAVLRLLKKNKALDH